MIKQPLAAMTASASSRIAMQFPFSSQPCGIVFSAAGKRAATYLPLETAEIHADIVDVSALITVTHKFWQYSPTKLPQAKYVFPVPARAAVCGFEMTSESGVVIVAVAKEKEQAKREYDAALRQGRMAGLLEHVTDDVFSLYLGALPPRQLLTTKITYILDLMDDNLPDELRLQLPMHIGMRYGAVPEALINTRRVPTNRISISVDVHMQGAVKSIFSPTHPTLILDANDSPAMLATASYHSPHFLTQDFVLCVKAEGLDAPRCFAQRASDGSVAMQLSIVPKLNLPHITAQEYIFLVDRSGSMDGPRMSTVRKALVMLLRALPAQGTRFNVFSFGSQCDSYWPKSAAYGQSTLTAATGHVDSMTANYGGTEIKHALNAVFASRRTDTPTAVFLLTDGESYDIDATFDAVAQAVKQVNHDAPLRVFTLGIGETTSTAMCEGIARAGNGLCLMAMTTESIIGKYSKLMRASRTYVLKNISIDWGMRPNLTPACTAGAETNSTIRQAPSHIPAIYPGNRFITFALIDDPTFSPPKEVVICGQRDGVGELLQFSVPVQQIALPSGQTSRPLIATLAARRAIMDVEDEGRRADSAVDVKDLVVRLGTTYQLASRHTSFVAVDTRTQKQIYQPQPSAPQSVEEEEYESDGDMGCMLVDEGDVRPPTPPPTNPKTTAEKIYALVRLQAFDGCFPTTTALEKLVGRGALAKAEEFGFPRKVWATSLAVAFLKSHMRGQPELLDGLVEKSIEFILRTPGVDIVGLLDKAESLLD